METEARRCRPLLGTLVEITVRTDDVLGTDALIDAAFDEIADVHRLMSFHEAGSDVSRINRTDSARDVQVDRRTVEVLRAACELHQLSAGAFDVAVAGCLQRMGLLPGAPRDASENKAPRTSDITLLPKNIVRKSRAGMTIDLGGIAKGYAVDRAIAILRAKGVGSALVNAGGDVACFGAAPWAIEIRDPRARGRVLCETTVVNGAMASSGGIFDPILDGLKFQPSIIDPRSRLPSRNFVGVTVRASSCILADGLTKAVMVLGEKSLPLLNHYGASAIAVSSEGTVTSTPDWPTGVACAA